MSESRVPENGMHGSIGGRWGGDHDHDRDGRWTFGPAPDVGIRVAEPAAYLTDRPSGNASWRAWPGSV